VLRLLTIILSVFCVTAVDHCIVCSLCYGCWPLHCLFFVWWLLTIALSVLCVTAVDHCIIFSLCYGCWPLYCLFFVLRLLTIALSVLCVTPVDHCIVCSLCDGCWPLYCLFFNTINGLILRRLRWRYHSFALTFNIWSMLIIDKM
jgi:hypothetical protein